MMMVVMMMVVVGMLKVVVLTDQRTVRVPLVEAMMMQMQMQ